MNYNDQTDKILMILNVSKDVYIILAYICLLLGVIATILHKELNPYYVFLVLFFTVKWILNYRKCTFSRAECLVRGVKKEQGYLYNLLENIVDIRYSNHIAIILVMSLWIIFYHYIIKKNQINI